MLYRVPSSFVYRKAFAQQEKGWRTWRVVTAVEKMADGRVRSRVYEPGLPSKFRAMRLARTLNACS